MTKKFDELFKRYQQGEVSKDERAEIEDELAKFRTLQDYLFETEELELEQNSDQGKDDTFDYINVKKEVKKKWSKQAFIVAIIAVITLLLIQVIGIPLVEKIYYNPMAGQTEEKYGEFSLYQLVTSQIKVGEKMRLSNVDIEHTGFANYKVTQYYEDPFNMSVGTGVQTIEKGKLKENINPSLMGNKLPSFFKADEWGEYNIEGLTNLPETSWLKVTVVLEPALALDDVAKIIEKQGIRKSHVFSVGIDTGDTMGLNNQGVNFAPTYQKTFQEKVPEDIQEKFPNLIPAYSLNVWSGTEKIEEHFLSSLAYLIQETPKVGEVFEMEKSEYDYLDYYQRCYDYVSKNGAKISTCTFALKPSQLKAVYDLPEVSFMSIQDVQLYSGSLSMSGE